MPVEIRPLSNVERLRDACDAAGWALTEARAAGRDDYLEEARLRRAVARYEAALAASRRAR